MYNKGMKQVKLSKEAWEEQVVKPTAHLTGYKNRIKKILATRENVK